MKKKQSRKRVVKLKDIAVRKDVRGGKTPVPGGPIPIPYPTGG